MSNRCKHSYDGISLICPFGCHGQISSPLEEITHIPAPKKKVWFSDYRPQSTINMVGQVIGKLTVKKHTGGSYFECVCKCGETTIRAGKDLRSAIKRKMSSACSNCKRKQFKHGN